MTDQGYRNYLVGLFDGDHRMHITSKSKYASKVQKDGMIQALRHNSLNGSLALKYNCTNIAIIRVKKTKKNKNGITFK